jgi:uncharacterized phiE125 gp8 family phage protein
MTTACYPVTRPVRSSEPAFENEPIDLATAKRQCGVAIDNNYQDEDFRRWIVTARRMVEHDAQIVFYTGTFTWKFTVFPWEDFFTIPCVRPVTSITSLVYLDSSGTSTTFSSSQYSLDTSGIVPMVKLNYGYVWPSTRSDINGITVTLVAGYASVHVMPDQYKAAVIPKVRSQYLEALGEDSRRDEELYDRLINLIGLESVG